MPNYLSIPQTKTESEKKKDESMASIRNAKKKEPQEKSARVVAQITPSRHFEGELRKDQRLHLQCKWTP